MATTTAAEDAFPIIDRTKDQLSVELVGLGARLLCEADPSGFRVGRPDAE